MLKHKKSFVPKARLIQILGEYLIKDATVGLLELIKNAYDADATEVHVEMHNLNQNDAKIVIRDNGVGMDESTFLNRWMNPATGHKEKEKVSERRTKLGRLPLGEKGVGRFATQQIGDDLKMISKTSKSTEELVALVDWTLFEDYDRDLSEVELDYSVETATYFRGRTSGTLLEITNLKSRWREADIKKVANALKRMKSPFKGANNFDVTLSFYSCPAEFERYSNLELTDIIDRAHYRMIGLINDNGVMQFEYTFNVPGYERVVREDSFDLRTDGFREDEELVCGGFIVNLNHYVKRNPEKWLQKSGVAVADVDELSGVSVYRDGIRILPYGEKGDDWLKLDNRRVQHTSKIGNDTVIGIVEINQVENKFLKDKTNREGLIENIAYDQFRRLILSAIKVLETEKEKDRPEKKPKPQIAEKLNDARKMIEDLAAKLSSSPNPDVQRFAADLKKIEFHQQTIKADVDQALEDSDSVNKQLFNLAGTGLAAERFTHEFARLVSGANASVTRLRELFELLSARIQSDKMAKIRKEINTISSALEALRNDIRLLGPMFYIKKVANEKQLDLRQVIDNTVLLQQTAITAEGITVSVEGDSFSVLMREGSCMQIFNNLIDNAVYWLSRKSESDDKKIKIILDTVTSSVFVSDNGPGVVSRYRDRIFDPFFSMKGEEGRGLGLYIIKEILQEKNWDIHLVDPDRFPNLLRGASFRVVFDKED